MEGLGSGMAIGLGAGLAIGIGISSMGRKGGADKKLKELVKDGRIRITDHRGNPITVDQLMVLASGKARDEG